MSQYISNTSRTSSRNSVDENKFQRKLGFALISFAFAW